MSREIKIEMNFTEHCTFFSAIDDYLDIEIKLQILQKEVVFRGVCSKGSPKRTGKVLHFLKMA